MRQDEISQEVSVDRCPESLTLQHGEIEEIRNNQRSRLRRRSLGDGHEAIVCVWKPDEECVSGRTESSTGSNAGHGLGKMKAKN